MQAGMPAVLHALRFLVVALFLLGCGMPEEAATAPQPSALKIPNSQLEPLTWADLDGWAEDDHAAAFKTFMVSCTALLPRAAQTRDAPPMLDALIQVCRRAAALPPGGKEQARVFFEKNFRPLAITPLGESAGFLTAYYEPIVQGSRTWSVDYQFPLYRKPSNLVVSSRHHMAGFPNKGEVGRRFGRRKMMPYYDREEIENGILTGRQLEICWLKDPVDAMFIQIQGSARVMLTDGSMMRVNYDAHNGYTYSAIGKFLIENGAIPRGEMSMDRIRQWMQANPEQGRVIRGKNRSFVFFREVQLPPQEEPKGAQGVSLTPGRSIAVDGALHVYGTPFFIQADLPIDSAEPTTKFRRLMISQDTGSAIVGPARADLYFGAGDAAGKIAGRLKQPGRFAMLVPRELDIFEPGRQRVPLPLPRPAHMAEKEKAAPVPLPRPRPKIEAQR